MLDRHDLRRITATTLAHYDEQRRVLPGRHARPRRQPEHPGAAAPLEPAPPSHPRLRLRAGARSRRVHGARPRGRRARRRRAISSRWRAAHRLRGAAPGFPGARPPAGHRSTASSRTPRSSTFRRRSCRGCSASCAPRCDRPASSSARTRTERTRRAGTAGRYGIYLDRADLAPCRDRGGIHGDRALLPAAGSAARAATLARDACGAKNSAGKGRTTWSRSREVHRGPSLRGVHGPSGTKLVTDAPVDNMGRGEMFSPDRPRRDRARHVHPHDDGDPRGAPRHRPLECTFQRREAHGGEPVRRIGRLPVTIRCRRRSRRRTARCWSAPRTRARCTRACTAQVEAPISFVYE